MNIVPRQSLEGVTPPGVSYNGFMGGLWAGVIVSGLVLLCRLLARFRGPRRLFWDDAFAISAFILVLITGAVWQWGAADMYYALDVQAGLEPYVEETFIPRMRRWLIASLVVELFFYTSLLLVKLAFMFFFRRLGDGIEYFKWVWWPVLVLTLGSYFGAVGNVHYKCLVGPVETILTECNTASSIKFVINTLKANCALDVLTDFLIMLLPTILLWRTQIRRAKKLALLGLFSLSLITMAIAIARVADINTTKRPDGNLDSSYLWLWSYIEPDVAIVVSCLSAFPQLFRQSSRNKKPVFNPSETYLRMMSHIRSKRKQAKSSSTELISVSQYTALDDSRFIPDPEVSSQRSQGSERPVLVPKTHRPVVHAYRGAHHDVPIGPADQITHQVEFTVTK